MCYLPRMRPSGMAAAPELSDERTSRRPGRPPAGSENKRERILVEANAIFARRGFAGTSIGDVAKAAGISKAGLLHHFASKESLVSEVLARRDAVDNELLAPESRTVWEHLDRWVELVERNSGVPGTVGLYTAMVAGGIEHSHPAHAWMHKHLLNAQEILERYFEVGKGCGHVARDAPSRELARSIVAVSDGIQIQWLCARADEIAAAGVGHVAGKKPIHGSGELDMAAVMRQQIDLIRTRWEGTHQPNKSR